MKKTTKHILFVAAAFIVLSLVTVCADVLVQYRQNYAAAPYVNADPSAVLTADDLLFQTPEDDATPERAPYLLGWLRDENVELYGQWHYRVTGLKARDARTEAEAELIEEAGYHLFTTEENTAFDALLRQLRFHPLKGIQNLLTHRKADKHNFVASFRLRTFYGGSEYDSEFSSLTPITLIDRKITRGEIFTVGDKAYLAGCFSVGSIYNETTGFFDENPAVQKNGRYKANPEQYSLFEIEPSDARTELLAQKGTFRGGENERVSRYAPFYPQYSAKIALLIETALFGLALLLLLTREKKPAVRLLSLLAAFILIACGTLTVVLHGDYMAMFRPSVYTNAQDNLFSFDELFSDVSQELLDYYKQESEWQPVITVSHRLQFVEGGTSVTPEEYGENGEKAAEIYAYPNWRSNHFSKADVDEFAGLLRELKYLPVKGVKSVLTAARMTDKNAFGFLSAKMA